MRFIFEPVKYFFRFLVIVLMAQVVLMINAIFWDYAIAWYENDNCMGWNCKEVYCPTGYAVQIADYRYLPCDKYDEYVDGSELMLMDQPLYREVKSERKPALERGKNEQHD